MKHSWLVKLENYGNGYINKNANIFVVFAHLLLYNKCCNKNYNIYLQSFYQLCSLNCHYLVLVIPKRLISDIEIS